MTPTSPVIAFRDIAVCYDPNQRYPVNALEGINLEVRPGEWVFVVGPLGAGKSSLLRLIYHGARATRGSITVDGQDVTNLAAGEVPYLRRKIGVVFQDFQLLPQKTVWENVAYALQVIGAPQKSMVRDVPLALETVGLHEKANALPHELSGGEQQRVAIARAIVNQPRILVADEPTGNLDPATAADIGEVLLRINEGGTTIVMASHDRQLVDSLRRRVVRIANGHIASDVEGGEYHPEDDPSPAPEAFAKLAVHSHAHPTGETNSPSSHPPETAGIEEPSPLLPPLTTDPSIAAIAAHELPALRRESVAAALPAGGHLHPHDRPLPEVALPGPALDETGYIRRSRENPSPIGSAENPIVLLDQGAEGER